MPVSGENSEILALRQWLGNMPRHPRQTHALNESDSEIIPIGAGRYLASTVDSVCEEIAYELYKDPYTMGWMTATASLSDLAAVGARPLGLLLSAHWASEFDLREKRLVARGVRDALRVAKTPLLGGDTGQSPQTHLTGVGLGICEGKPLSRRGIRADDVFCMTGRMGLGPALGFRRLLGDPHDVIQESDFRPRARLDAGRALRTIAHAAMDTSDGLASTLNTLCQINGVGLRLEWSPRWLHPKARRYCEAMGIPPVALLFGEHGDFQLIVAIPCPRFEAAKKRIPDLIPLGQAVPIGQGTSILDSRGKYRKIELDFVARARKNSLEEIVQVFRSMLKYAGKFVI